MNEKIAPAVAIETLGCKLNQAESQLLSRDFSDKGFRLAEPEDECDVYILNTCTVTHVADRKARHLLRFARRRNPGAFVVATGCLAERRPEELRALGGIDLVTGNAEKQDLPVQLQQLVKFDGKRNVSPPEKTYSPRTRAMVKIQDGCSQCCTYCIVPQVRGKGKSLDAAAIVEQIRKLEAEGYKEIVLTGSNIGSYKSNGTNLAGLLQSILEKTTIERLRLSSVQPQEISSPLLSLWQNPRLCRHVHLPLQSGSDSVLDRMGRHYDVASFRQAAARLREALPGVAITTDIIVGFPGEGPSNFEETLALCKELGLARIHAFPYSPRPGTVAALMAPGVPAMQRNQRLEKMLELAEEISHKYKEHFLGRTIPVLWERPVKGETNLWSGLTDNYIRVHIKTERHLQNQVLPARLLKIEKGRVWGELKD